jgi:hypothetical protein
MLCCGVRIDFRLGLLVLDLRPFLLWHLIHTFHLQSILCVQVVALRMFVDPGICSCLHIVHLDVLFSISRLLLVVFPLECLVMLLSLPLEVSNRSNIFVSIHAVIYSASLFTDVSHKKSKHNAKSEQAQSNKQQTNI